MMTKLTFVCCPLQRGKLLILLTVLALGVFAPPSSHAHQQPNTIILLDVSSDKVLMELQIPLSELELAFGHDVAKDSDTLIERLSPHLKDYLIAHIRPMTADKQLWSVEVTEMKLEKAEQTRSGPFQEITIHLNLTPPAGAGTRKFVLNYDVIMHQVVSHYALVSIRNDWESGIVGERPVAAGAITVDTKTTQIYPLEINLKTGGWLEGFKSMVSLGIRHIREGTDHLLFLLVLLLPATLTVNGKHWGDFGGTKYSVGRLFKVVTAFTAGHSITLLIGAAGGLPLPQQSVEILIAVSILISAVHAVRPIFSGKEMYIAAGFGLVHGLAFASALTNLRLSAGETALSILGFNMGIELMQLFVIALIVPWLILLTLTPFYKSIRITGAVLAAVAAIAWIVERISGSPNSVGGFIRDISEYSHLGILTLALIAAAAFGLRQIKDKQHSVETRPLQGNAKPFNTQQ